MIVLDGSQIRQLIDVEQIFAAYRSARREYALRFKGSMSWKTVGGHEYLYLKKAGVAKSLGARSAETERSHAQFQAGRAAVKTRIATLDQSIRRMAPINRAMRLGRVPVTSAKLLRRLDTLGLIGDGLRVAGTHALYAYESLAGVHFDSRHVATMDVDLLYDARSALKLLGETAEGGLIGQLQRVDASFRPTEPGSFRAVNDAGFMVDLITPARRNPATARPAATIATAQDDLRAVEVAGLTWLENSPSIDRMALDERGYPLRIVAPDPRAFAMHKAWVAARDDRDPPKRRRDLAQARAVASVIAHQLPDLRFDDPGLRFLPKALLDLGTALVAEVRARGLGPDDEPWD